MNLRNAALVFFGIATIPLGVAIYSVHRDLTATPAEKTARGHVYGKASVGDHRLDLLVKFTRLYIKQHADAPAAMREGAELAPPSFLNRQLESKGVKWRVRTVHGLVPDMYEVT
jgi:hypothetical protein